MAFAVITREVVKAEFNGTLSAQAVANNFNSHERAPSIVALADGGFAVAYELVDALTPSFSGIVVERYNADGTLRPGQTFGATLVKSPTDGIDTDSDPVLVQLSDDRLLVAWTQTGGSGNGIRYAIVDPTSGAVTTASTLMPGTGSLDFAPHIVPLATGGWALAKQSNYSASDQDADLFLYDATGAGIFAIGLGGDTVADEQHPAVAVLAKSGNVVVVYEKEKTDNSDNFSIGIEILPADGSTHVLRPTVLDAAGVSDPDILALPSGDFVVAYARGSEVALIVFNAAGGIDRSHEVGFGGNSRADPVLTLQPNGFVSVAFTDDTGQHLNVDAILFDPVNGVIYFGDDIDVTSGNQFQPTTATLANGNIVAAWTDSNTDIDGTNADPYGEHLALQIFRWVRTTTSDDTSEPIFGDDLVDVMYGNDGDDSINSRGGIDTLSGGRGNDTLDGGPGTDFMLGGEGHDTYYVDDTFDLVDEGIVFPGYGFGGRDTIISQANWFWDVYSVGEVMRISEGAADPTGAGTTIVGSIWSNEMIGNLTTNILFGRGGADTYRAGDGVDFISLSLLGLTDQNAYAGVNGVNTIIVDKRTTGPNSYDIIFEFESGKDKVNVASYGYANVAQVLARGHDDGAGSSYFALGDGLDYVYFVGLTKAQIAAGDFII